MVQNVKLNDEFYYLDRTRGIYRCKILRILETNGKFTYFDENRREHYPEELFYNKKDIINSIPQRLKYTDKPELPAGTKDFKYGDKVYFIEINPYMIHDAVLNLSQKSTCTTYEGYTYKYRGTKEGYFSQDIYKPFATLEEVKEYILK
jgi:hypothetical protein